MPPVKLACIYAIRNNENGKVYVGETTDYARRQKTHMTLLEKGEHHSPHLQEDWDKYGSPAFEFVILESLVNTTGIVTRENRWIDKLDALAPNGYNVHTRQYKRRKPGQRPNRWAARGPSETCKDCKRPLDNDEGHDTEFWGLCRDCAHKVARKRVIGHVPPPYSCGPDWPRA